MPTGVMFFLPISYLHVTTYKFYTILSALCTFSI